MRLGERTVEHHIKKRSFEFENYTAGTKLTPPLPRLQLRLLDLEGGIYGCCCSGGVGVVGPARPEGTGVTRTGGGGTSYRLSCSAMFS